MELESIAKIKKQYINALASEAEYLDIIENMKERNEDSPISYFKALNPEDVPNYNNEERELQEILLDLAALDSGTIEIKDYVDSLFNRIDSCVELVAKAVKKEDERIRDMNMLCGQSSEYNMVIPMYITDFSESEDSFESLDDKTVGASLLSNREVSYKITSLSGNGLPWDTFSYRILKLIDGKYQADDENKNITAISDESDITGYDYKRYLTNKRAEAIDGIINYDDKEVECVITLASDVPCCKIKLVSETKDLKIRSLETSDDGINWLPRLSKPIKINSSESSYTDNSYIYETGILCFPYSSYIRITVASDIVTDEAIAIENSDGEIFPYSGTKCKSIRINNIRLYSSEYKDAEIKSVNILESGSVDKISLFASEYIPDHFNAAIEYIKYYLAVNGTEYEIVPVNSGREGISLIKYSEVNDSSAESNKIKLIEETIKNARLRVSIKTHNDKETPYVSNLKLCLGKDTGSIYVSG